MRIVLLVLPPLVVHAMFPFDKIFAKLSLKVAGPKEQETHTEIEKQQALTLKGQLMNVWDDIRVQTTPYTDVDKIKAGSEIKKDYWLTTHSDITYKLHCLLNPYLIPLRDSPPTQLVVMLESKWGRLDKAVHKLRERNDFSEIETELSSATSKVIEFCDIDDRYTSSEERWHILTRLHNRAKSDSNPSLESWTVWKTPEQANERTTFKVTSLEEAKCIFKTLAIERTGDKCFRVCLQECITKLIVITQYIWTLIRNSPYVISQGQNIRYNVMKQAIENTAVEAGTVGRKLCLYQAMDKNLRESPDLRGCDMVLHSLGTIFAGLAEISWESVCPDLALAPVKELGAPKTC